MNKQTKNITSIILATIILAACITLLPITANAEPTKDNPNQDFTGTPVNIDIDAPDTIYINDEAQIIIKIQNVANRAIPDVSIWVNGAKVSGFDLAKGTTKTHTITVDTSEIGSQIFEIEVWTRLGNKNFQDLLSEEIVVITVYNQIKSQEEWLNDFRNALNEALEGVEDPFSIVTLLGKNTYGIVLTVDGIEFTFIGGGSLNSTMKLNHADAEYKIVSSGNPKAFEISYTLN